MEKLELKILNDLNERLSLQLNEQEKNAYDPRTDMFNIDNEIFYLDSVDSLEIIAYLNEEYNIEYEENLVNKIQSISSLAQLISLKGGDE